MSGFAVLYRASMDHPLFREDMARLGAWTWLIMRAAWKPTPYDINGKIVTLERGQVCASIRQLASDWGWSKSAVDRFLTRLETETMIEREAGQGKCILTICNYAKYQDVEKGDRDSSGTPSGTAAGQQRDTKEQGNQLTSKQEPNGSSLSSPDQPDLVFAKWNEIAAVADIPSVRSISPARRKACQARIKEHGFDAVIQAIEHIPKSAFLRGETGNWTGANMKFFLRPETVNNILEGQYDDRTKLPQLSGGQSDKRDGIARALDRRLGLDQPAGTSGRCDLAAGNGDQQSPPLRIASMR